MAGVGEELTDLPGVGPRTAAALRAAGFGSVGDLRGADEAALLAVEGVGPRLAAAIVRGVAGSDPAGDDVEASAGWSGGLGGPEVPAALADLIQEAPNVLVLSEHARTDDGCAAVLDHQTTAEDGLVLVSFVESADERLEAIASLPGTDRGVTLVCMGEQTRSATTDTTTLPSPLGEVTVTAIPDAADLFRLGVHVSRALDRAGGRPALCLHSLSALVGLVDLQRAFRFLHVLSRRVRAVDGRAHYHLDPGVVDEQTYATLRPLFDVVLRFQDGEWLLE